jgi:hypothetical protein
MAHERDVGVEMRGQRTEFRISDLGLRISKCEILALRFERFERFLLLERLQLFYLSNLHRLPKLYALCSDEERNR